MLSFNNEDPGLEGEQYQQEQSIIRERPQTVSSLSSIDSAGYEQSESAYVPNSIQQSALPPLPPQIDNSGSSTVVTAPATAETSYALPAHQTNFVSSTVSAGTLEPVTSAPASSNLQSAASIQITSSTGVLVASTPNTNTVPEFLYQLTKMLTDNNRDIIEWSNGKIEVHSPHKLETHVLNRYFRHSKFASFQRQLNYFGFRKLAGKGKMAPCSYVNDATTDELGSLLLIKRKQGNEPKSKSGSKKRDRSGKETKSRSSSSSKGVGDRVNPVLAGILHGTSDSTPGITRTTSSKMQQSQKAIARVAVGKGVRHGYVPQRAKSTQNYHVPTTSTGPSPVQASLNALTQNFNQSMHETTESAADVQGDYEYQLPEPTRVTAAPAGHVSYVPGSLHRDDSLVDLAMIPLVGDGTTADSNAATSSGFSFVDFPFDSNIFANEDPHI